MTKARKTNDTLRVIVDAKRMSIPEEDFRDPAIEVLAHRDICSFFLAGCDAGELITKAWDYERNDYCNEVNRTCGFDPKTIDFMVLMRVDELLQQKAAEVRESCQKKLRGE